MSSTPPAAPARSSPPSTAPGFYDGGSQTHGFIRDALGNFTIIDPPGSTHTNIFALNDSGQVAGFFFDSFSQQHGFIATPQAMVVPEPAMATLFGLGLACLAARRWRPSTARSGP